MSGNRSMRFAVFGGGALGSLVATRLAEHHDVGLVGRREHVDAIRAGGLRVSGHTECRARNISAVTDARDLDPSTDAILLTVKSYDTETAVGALERFWGGATFVSLQNGLGNEELIATRAARVMGAVINQGVTFVEPGHVFHAGAGETRLGPFRGVDREDAERMATAFTAAGLLAKAVPDIRREIWGKVVLNAAVNPLTALLGLRTGDLLDGQPIAAVLESVVEESVAIAAACGISLEAADILAAIDAVARATRDNKSSMLQDLERGRRTEIDAINGALVARAAEHGVACPLNQLLVHLVAAAETSRPST